MRGIKYGIVTSAAVYFFFPVVRRLTFLRRFTVSMFPMYYFCKWGYTWGHEHFWRKAKEVVVSYEMYSGTRNKFTMK